MALKFNLFGYHCDYLSDRLCRLYSVLLFFIIAIILSVELQDSNAVQCWTPAQFTGAHVLFTNNYCRSGATWHLIPSEDGYIPREDEDIGRMDGHMEKMNFIPVLLIGQALLFLLPWIIWRFVSDSCCSLEATVRDCNKLSKSSELVAAFSELKKVAESTVVSIIMCVSYLLTKMSYGILCLVQMGILSYYLGINFFSYNPWTNVYSTENNVTKVEAVHTYSNLFPGMVICDMQIRRLGNMQRYTVQCAVPVSETIERCLYVIWAWLVIVVVIIAISGMLFVLKAIIWFIGVTSENFVQRKLGNLESFRSADKKIHTKFIRLYINPGLLLALQIIEKNGSLLGVTSIINGLWEDFLSSSKIETAPQETMSYTAPLIQSEPQAAGPYSYATDQLKQVEASQL